MNPESPQTPREKLEARLTALLLGELSAEEAAATRDAIAHDAELSQLHERLKQTIGLVRETVASPAGELAAKPEELRLSATRREKLMEHFKAKREPEPKPEVIVPRRRWQMPWFVPLSAAAAVVIAIGVMLPAFQPARSRAQRLTMLPSRIQMMERIGEPSASERVGKKIEVSGQIADVNGAVDGESFRKRLWFAQKAAGAPPLTTLPPTAELPPAPLLAAEPKPQIMSVVVLPESKSEDASVSAGLANEMRESAGRQRGFASQGIAQGGAGAATFGGFAGGGGSGGAAGLPAEQGEKRLLSRVERLAEARESLGRSTAGGPASTPAPPAIAPAAPPVQSMAGVEPAYRGDARGGLGAAGPAAAPPTTPAPAQRPAARRSLGEQTTSEGLASRADAVASGIEPVQAGTLTMTAADPKARVELKQITELDAASPQVGLKLQKSFERAKELAAGQGQATVRNEPAATVESEQLGEVAGKPAAVVNFSAPGATAGAGSVNLGDAPALGQLFEGQRAFFDENGVSPTKPSFGTDLGGRGNESRFGLNVAKAGDDVTPLQAVDSLAANANGRQERFADFSGVADRTAPAKQLKDMEAAGTEKYFFGQSRAGGGRGGASDQKDLTANFADRFDAYAGATDKKAAGVEAKAKDDVAKGTAVQAGGVYSVNAVGYANLDADLDTVKRSHEEFQAWVTTGVTPESAAKASIRQAEDSARRQAEIALPKLQIEEGRPVGERSAGRFLAGETEAVTSDESTLRRKLDSIRIAEFSSDSLPLGQVIEAIGREAKTQDPDKKGINIALRDARDSSIDSKPPVDPTTGLPDSEKVGEATDLNAVTVKLPPMRNVTLGQALDAIAKAADQPLDYQIQPQGIVVSAKGKASRAKVGEDVAARRPAPNAPIPQPEIRTADNAFSTFSLNVSDVSFKLAAASLEKGAMPDAATVRAEEFINAFDYRDAEPAGAPIAFACERARYPFAHNRDLLRFSVKTAAAGRQPGRPLNLVLLLDNSGSMERADRVRIIQQCLRVLAGQLRAEDRLSVVTFARTARLWVDGVPGTQAAQVAEQVGGLTPQGGTNLEEAMNLAYATARRHYLANGVNRVVLLTDGAANLGDVEPENLKKKVETFRQQGIALDCFGIGWEGYNDDLLEVLSRNGDGRYGFVNTPEAAYAEFAGQLAGALKVAASDVKVQVEFNPKRVTAYRQIGYAKHQLTKEQFRDNTVDAAEIGAAEAGNALYVVEVNPRGEGPLAVVRVRYKVPGTADYREHEWAVPFTGPAVALEIASPAMRLAATAGAFSEWLTGSPFAGEVTPDALLGLMSGVPDVFGADARPKKLEWMIRQAKSLAGK